MLRSKKCTKEFFTPKFTIYGTLRVQIFSRRQYFDFFDGEKSSFLIIYKSCFMSYNTICNARLCREAEYQPNDTNTLMRLFRAFFFCFVSSIKTVIVNKFVKLWILYAEYVIIYKIKIIRKELSPDSG